MNVLWTYFWPLFGAGLLVGGVAGSIAFRRRARRNAALLVGLTLALGWAGLWHWPLGAADRFSARVDRSARQALDYYEMTQITAHLHRGPLTRSLILSGPADDFQTSELVRLMSDVPGVGTARWSNRSGDPPLIAEGGAVALLGFLFGLFLAYLNELRRRHNAQWNW